MSSEEKDKTERELYNTIDQERILLKFLFTQIITARKYFSKVQEELFSSHQRLWMFRNAKKIFKDTGNLFSDAVISSELDRIKKVSIDIEIGRKRVTREISHTEVLAEWNMIIGSDLLHTPEWLMSDLGTKRRARLFMLSTEIAVDRVLRGESDEAINELNSDLIKIKSNITKSKPLRRLSDPSWQVEIIRQKQENPHLYTVLKSGFQTFDMKAGFYRGEITLIMAHTGVGKSTLMRSMAMGAALAGLNVLFVVNEEIEDQVGNKFAVIKTKFPYKVLKNANKDDFSEEDIAEFSRILSDREGEGEIFIQELSQYHTCADIEEIMVDLQQQGERLDIIMLDYLDHLKPMEKAWSEVDEQNKSIAEFKSICMQFRVAGVTATQADTQSVDSENMSAYNVRGSKQKSGAANIVVAIRELAPPDGDRESGLELDNITWKISILKNRDGAKFFFLARFHKATGTVREKSSCSKEEIEEMDKDLEMRGRKRGRSSSGKSAADAKKDGIASKKESSKDKEEKSDLKETEKDDEKTEDISDITDMLTDFEETPKKSKLKPPIKRSAGVDEKAVNPAVLDKKIVRSAAIKPPIKRSAGEDKKVVRSAATGEKKIIRKAEVEKKKIVRRAAEN